MLYMADDRQPMKIYRLAHIMGEISFGIYPLKGITKDAQSENSRRLTTKVRELWSELPLSLGVIHPDGLSPYFRLRSLELRIFCNHAIVLANRPFLLGRSDTERPESEQVANMYKENAQQGVYAALTVLDIWESAAEERTVFGAYWMIHYAGFTAISALYLYIILSSR